MAKSKKDISIRQVNGGYIVSTVTYTYGNEQEPEAVTKSDVEETVAAGVEGVLRTVQSALEG